MRAILHSRLLHWKHQIIPLLFWLLLPIIAIIGFTQLMNGLQKDSQIPVGIVLEEKTELALNLADKLDQSPLIRLDILEEEQALRQLEKHELDSVFIIREGYQDQIKKGSRNGLVKSYQSDLSFAYTPISEMVASYVQEETSRMKTAFTVQQLSKQYELENTWTMEEISEKSKDIERDQNLLRTTFTFENDNEEQTNNSLPSWNKWGLWAIFALLSTLFLFDWVIKEKRQSMQTRFPFIRFSFTSYCLWNTLLYGGLFFISDIITLLVFHFLLDQPISLSKLGSMMSFRLMLVTGTFLLAANMRNRTTYYGIAFIITLLTAIISGAIIPADGIVNQFPIMKWLNPLAPFLNNELNNFWLYAFLLLIMIWYIRKEKSYASYR
ncbi:MAG: ABC transporter permease [Bacillota bacterium]